MENNKTCYLTTYWKQITAGVVILIIGMLLGGAFNYHRDFDGRRDDFGGRMMERGGYNRQVPQGGMMPGNFEGRGCTTSEDTITCPRQGMMSGQVAPQAK